MSNGSKQEVPWSSVVEPTRPGSWDAGGSFGGTAGAVEDAERALLAAEAALDAFRVATNPVTWEARRHDLEQGIAVTARALDAALRGVGPHDLAAIEFRLAELVRALVSARPPERIALEAELIAALAARPAGSDLEGHARKEAAIDALLRRLGVADSRTLLARIERRAAGDALVAWFHALAEGRRERLLGTLRGAPRREARASEAARRSALAAGEAAAVFAGPARAEGDER
ncbi:MAG TPA: hypothetical protein VFT22_09485 [Kofleriaceae bacterium]|nr:hypothetical protein [Kofleriaceae bacterium]